MITTFRIEADQLDKAILRSIKEAFKGKQIEIIISETESKSDSEALLKRIENLKKNKNTTVFEPSKFFKTYRKKIADAKN